MNLARNVPAPHRGPRTGPRCLVPRCHGVGRRGASGGSASGVLGASASCVVLTACVTGPTLPPAELRQRQVARAGPSITPRPWRARLCRQRRGLRSGRVHRKASKHDRKHHTQKHDTVSGDTQRLAGRAGEGRLTQQAAGSVHACPSPTCRARARGRTRTLREHTGTRAPSPEEAASLPTEGPQT